MSGVVASVANWLTRGCALLSIPIATIAADHLPSATPGGYASRSTTQGPDAGNEFATDRSLPVIGIAARDNAEQGQALTWALRQALDSSIEWKSESVDDSFDTLVSASGCPQLPDSECLARIAKRTNLPRFVWGALRVAKGRIKVNLGLYESGSASLNAQFEYSATFTDTFDEDLLRLASVALGQMLGPLHFPVIVHSRERTGEIWVDEVSVGKLSDGTAKVSATVGDHRIRLVLPDATTIARSFHIRVDHPTQLRLDFIDVPEG
jgi:hypothetical protein